MGGAEAESNNSTVVPLKWNTPSVKKILLGWQHMFLQKLQVPFCLNGAFADVLHYYITTLLHFTTGN